MDVQLFVVTLTARMRDQRPNVIASGVYNSRAISATNISSWYGDCGADDCIVNGVDDVHGHIHLLLCGLFLCVAIVGKMITHD